MDRRLVAGIHDHVSGDDVLRFRSGRFPAPIGPHLSKERSSGGGNSAPHHLGQRCLHGDRQARGKGSQIKYVLAGTSQLSLNDQSMRFFLLRAELMELKASVWRVLRNPVIICSCGSSVFTLIGIYGYVAWVPKYFEHEFRKSKSSAALLSGKPQNGCPAMNQSHGIQSYLRFGGQRQHDLRRARQRFSYEPLPAQRSFSGRFRRRLQIHLRFRGAFRCDVQLRVREWSAGDADGQRKVRPLQSFATRYESPVNTSRLSSSLSLSGSCSQDCHCNTEKFSPVCLRGDDGVNQTYFSPCHAGCIEASTIGNRTSYSECLCDINSKVETGFCMKSCKNIYVYMIVLAVVKFIVSLSYVGNLITDLR